MATCGEVRVQLLESYGVDTVFGIPGRTCKVVGSMVAVGRTEAPHGGERWRTGNHNQ